MTGKASEYDAIVSLVKDHEKWFSESLPLVASENVASRGVREVLSSDLGQRYAEGWPGERVYAGCKYIDKIELAAIDLARRLFKAEFADVRPVSGACANLAVYSTISNPGDTMMALSIPNGGHISAGKKEFSGTAGLVHGLEIEYFAFDRENMTIDVDGTKKRLRSLKAQGKAPKIVMFGGSLILFPQPVQEIAEEAEGIGAVPCYDAAHVAGLIAGGQFQDPLREGAHLMSFSTHKTLFGPQGGVIVGKRRYADGIKKAVFPGTSSNHHLHNVAGKALTFTEFLKYGKLYAKDVVTNASVLAESLAELGENVIGESKGYTRSHQVALDVTKYGDGGVVEKKLESMNIIANRQLLPGDLQAGRHYTNPGGIRLGVAEITRLGMDKADMREVADILHQALATNKTVIVRKRVADLRKDHQHVAYAFDKSDAYFYERA
ncbi:MAG: serine hydroxymethyltransferase [Nitrososphaerota archaeon]|jgi:glycine hydroxymethyltransferase|nr:serine hydroxymethyltransferase [Nitrososphaerota archaeon]